MHLIYVPRCPHEFFYYRHTSLVNNTKKEDNEINKTLTLTRKEKKNEHFMNQH
jgi:hypothetical protein